MYRLLLSGKAEKALLQFQKRNPRLFRKLMNALEDIAADPYSAKPLTGDLSGYYSYRVGDYRIIYEIDAPKLVVYVEKLLHRKEVYR
jgi:mRNA interferase RelE/StbE